VSWIIVFTKQAQKDAKKIASSNLKPQAQRLLELLAENPFTTPAIGDADRRFGQCRAGDR